MEDEKTNKFAPLFRLIRYVFSHVMECTLLVVLFRVFGIRSSHCLSHFTERVTIRVSVYIGILLQFKVIRRHLSLYFCQFSFTFAVNLNAQLNQFNYERKKCRDNWNSMYLFKTF